MDVSSIALQGLERAQAQVERTASRLASVGSGSPDGGVVDTLDLSQEMVALLSSKSEFAANINMLKVADDMQKSTISLLA